MTTEDRHRPLTAKKSAFQKKLQGWHNRHQRDLPWRSRPSLYKTVVSEFMLQQTQVKTVIPYFERWLEAFCDFEALANASPENVLKHWEGLGYYSRARHLHTLARRLVTLHDIPQTPKEWLKFSGVGPYTASAITSISFGHPAATVDGNVVRVLARMTADPTEFKDNSRAVRHFTGLADSLLDHKNPGLHNQAMMELGALICLRRNPTCLHCPVKDHCAAYATSKNPETFPHLTPKTTTRVKINRLWVSHKKTILLRHIPKEAQRLANLWELPLADGLTTRLKSQDLLIDKPRSISNQRIQESIYRTKATAGLLRKVEQNDCLHWVPIDEVDTITLSGPHRKWIKVLLSHSITQPNVSPETRA